MQNKGEHNFKLIHNHHRAVPGKVVWRCDDCDTEILLPMGLDQVLVNREMANKMLCIKPDPKDKAHQAAGILNSKGKLIN